MAQTTMPTQDVELSKIELVAGNRGLNKELEVNIFEEWKIQEIGESIVENGLLQPIIIEKYNNEEDPHIEYKIVTGNRRYTAFKYIERIINAMIADKNSENDRLKNMTSEEKLKEIKKFRKITCIIREIENDDEREYIHLAENLSRKDYPENEKAKRVHSLFKKMQIEKTGRKNKGYGTLAQRLGISRSYVQKLIGMIEKDGYNEDLDGNEAESISKNDISIENAKDIVENTLSLLTKFENISNGDKKTKQKVEEEIEEILKKIRNLNRFLKLKQKELIQDLESNDDLVTITSFDKIV